MWEVTDGVSEGGGRRPCDWEGGKDGPWLGMGKSNDSPPSAMQERPAGVLCLVSIRPGRGLSGGIR
jgi:hypothetical protein